MSRFKNLRRYLPFAQAVSIYWKVKFNNSKHLTLKKLACPFTLRNNPFDYATFEEVLLREEYNIPLHFAPATIIDAGANIGLTAIYFANVFPSAIIVSLEPDQENYELLQLNTQPYKNVLPLQYGLWSHNSYLQVIDDGNGNNAFTVKEVANGTINAIKAISVQDILNQQNWDVIDMLKIDIEGSEKIVFGKDYESWLPKVKVLIIELHDRMIKGASAAVFKAMGQYNFSFDIKGENVIFINNDLL